MKEPLAIGYLSCPVFNCFSLLLFRKGSLRAGAKWRFEHCLFVSSFVRSFVSVLSDSSCLQDCQQWAVHLYIVWSLLPVALPDTTSGYYFRLHFRYYFRLHFRVLLQSEKDIAMHSLCETSCPPRTVHSIWDPEIVGGGVLKVAKQHLRIFVVTWMVPIWQKSLHVWTPLSVDMLWILQKGIWYGPAVMPTGAVKSSWQD